MLALVLTAFPSLTLPECAGGFIAAGLDLRKFELYDTWFDENSTVTLVQAGVSKPSRTSGSPPAAPGGYTLRAWLRKRDGHRLRLQGTAIRVQAPSWHNALSKYRETRRAAARRCRLYPN